MYIVDDIKKKPQPNDLVLDKYGDLLFIDGVHSKVIFSNGPAKTEEIYTSNCINNINVSLELTFNNSDVVANFGYQIWSDVLEEELKKNHTEYFI